MAAKRILIIDDDLELCEELGESLRGEGFCVDSTSDPFQGENLIMKNRYHAVILDYKMPGLVGADILKKIKSTKSKQRIFIVSGRPFIERTLKEEGLADRISAIFEKPLDFNALLEKINKI